MLLILVRELAALELPALLIMSGIWGISENIYSLRALPSLTQSCPPGFSIEMAHEGGVRLRRDPLGDKVAPMPDLAASERGPSTHSESAPAFRGNDIHGEVCAAGQARICARSRQLSSCCRRRLEECYS